ncbi:PEP-CTERM sorting domain-containing protein [Stieleria sp. ICT_E10.1]|uniref:PEP-CTERM sorting domain-containing protein n=1 Tax=Stieleria sedimenti TaxID=2976331 RepID=UPI00217F571A|nr:PEP-CTERM sorting domain-containing protein [Stieleria sedimenti]MCS7467400.1 PEP-CTERM sorting domain-containing protein [Stieleria sedimenti]
MKPATLFWTFLLFSFIVMEHPKASAAIVGYTDYASFQSAAFGSESVIDFDSIPGGNSINTIDDVTFSSGGSMSVYVTDGITDGTISPDNFIGNANFAFPEFENEVITMSFGTGRSAAGIFVVYEGSLSTSFSLTSAGGSQSLEATSTVIDLPGPANGYFLGLVDNTGANSINSVSLQNPTSDRPYYFDSQTSFIASPVTIPEPGSFAMLALVGSVVGCRRRR